MDQHVESTFPVPDPTVHSSNSDPDPLPSDHDQTVADEISRCINDELQKQLVLEEAWLDEEPSGYANGEEEEKEEEFMNGGSDVDGEEAVVGEEEEEEAQNGSNEAHYDNWGEDVKVGDEFAGGLKSVKSNGSSSSNGSKSYPVRPEAENCSFYMKTDNCKFGSNCKFNHPVKRKAIKAAKDNVKDKEEGTKKAGQTECKYYLRTGGCKYGGACRFNHSKSKSQAFPTKTQVLPAKTITSPVSEFNFLGLPIRPGEIECPYYMRNGSCKYGSNCRFNHPDPTAVAGNDPPSAFGNGRSAIAQSSSQASGASWSSPRALNGSSLFMPAMFPVPQTQSVPPRSPEWKGYQAPLYPPDISAHQPPAYNIGNPRTGSNVYMQQQQQQQQQITGDEFPERPGQPECSYFLKTGDCKFRSNCKYHHPKNRNPKSSPYLLSDKGLPLRPDQMICSHYSRYGICKFGPACKFDHPEHHVPSTGPGEYQSTPFGNYEKEENARMGESRNGSDAAMERYV